MGVRQRVTTLISPEQEKCNSHGWHVYHVKDSSKTWHAEEANQADMGEDGDSDDGADDSMWARKGRGKLARMSASKRKRDWVRFVFAARNMATVVYALSYTITLPVLPFMANRHIYPQEPDPNIPGDLGSSGVREAWRGLAYGLVMSGYYLTKMVAAPWIGFLSDKVGRRQALVVTLLGGGFSFLVTMLVGQYSLHGIILCRLLMGCFAANGALMHAYIRDTVPQEWQSSAFSQHSASWGVAYLGAAPLLAWKGDETNTVLLFATVSMVVAALIVQVRFVDTRPGRSKSKAKRETELQMVTATDSGSGGVGTGGARASSGEEVEGDGGVGAQKQLGRQSNGDSKARNGEPCECGDCGGLSGDSVGNGTMRRRGMMTRASTAAAEGAVKAVATPSEMAPIVSRTGINRWCGGNLKEEVKAKVVGGREERVLESGVERGKIEDREGKAGEGPRQGGTAIGVEGGAEGGGGKTETVLNNEQTSGGNEGAQGDHKLGNRRALIGVFQRMMSERLVLATFLLQTLRPAQDLAPLVAHRFSGGAGMLAGISSVRALCRVLVPMTPFIPALVKRCGSNDRLVAAGMCVAMAALGVMVPRCRALNSLHHVMAAKGLCSIVRDSVAGAVLSRVAGTSNIGAFFGWQHFMKAVSGAFSYMVTSWLSSFDLALPYYITAMCDLGYAITYLYA